MSAPLCLQCGDPVKAPDRVFCSRRCSGLAKAATGALARFNRERSQQFYALTIREVVGTRWRSGQGVTVAQLVAVARATYKAGYNAAYQRMDV